MLRDQNGSWLAVATNRVDVQLVLGRQHALHEIGVPGPRVEQALPPGSCEQRTDVIGQRVKRIVDLQFVGSGTHYLVVSMGAVSKSTMSRTWPAMRSSSSSLRSWWQGSWNTCVAQS